MKLFTQAFLEGAGLDGSPLAGLEQLTALFGINVKQHPVYPELYHLSYDQLESPKGHPIVKECRGIILNSADNWAVVAYPFNRFCNYGETWGDTIDWTSVRVQEKVDGSMCILWNYKGTWNVSTKGSPDAGGTVGDFSFTFSELFWKTLKQYVSDLSDSFEPTFTYMFELTSRYNRVVVQHNDPALTLIGVRDNVTYNELPVSQFDRGVLGTGIPVVQEFPLTTVKEIETAALALDPMHNEGFVVVDKNFNRVKMKSPSYVMIHHLKDGFGQRRIIRLIQLGEKSEILAYFPEYLDLFNEIESKIDSLILEIEAEYARIKHLTDRKEFALEATKSKNSGVLFALFLGKTTSVRDYILHSKKVMKKATVTDAATEGFMFSEDKIERMIGLSHKQVVVLE
jgi:hypothetical protein